MGTPVPVIGSTRLHFEVNGMCMFADVLVTESVQELILGFERLVNNN